MDYFSGNDIMKIAGELKKKHPGSWVRQARPKKTTLVCTHLKLAISCIVKDNHAILQPQRG